MTRDKILKLAGVFAFSYALGVLSIGLIHFSLEDGSIGDLMRALSRSGVTVTLAYYAIFKDNHVAQRVIFGAAIVFIFLGFIAIKSLNSLNNLDLKNSLFVLSLISLVFTAICFGCFFFKDKEKT